MKAKLIMNFKIKFIFCLFLLSISLGFNNENFRVVAKYENQLKLNYKNESLKIKEDNQKFFLIDELSGLEDISHFPSHSMFYQIEDGQDITVNYSVNNSHTENNIYISDEIRTSSDDQYYPENNLIISDPMIFRGVVVKQITFYPFRLNLESGDMEIYNNVDVIWDSLRIPHILLKMNMIYFLFRDI